jgi:hypothetical protein
MTTKPKTRKAPATKPVAVDPAPKKANGEPKREISEIWRLVTRWHWLEADQEYQGSIADTESEWQRIIAIHNDEQRKIERKLATLIPENFEDVGTLLEFATKMGEDGSMVSGADRDMLKNVREGLRMARAHDSVAARDKMKAERDKGFAAARDYIHRALEWSDKIEASKGERPILG